MADQKMDATGQTPVATSYEQGLKATAARRAATDDWPGNPVPDTPRGVVHVNPALTPAPAKIEIPERMPVPVINDPGVVGANPDLGALNMAYRQDAMGVPLPDPTEGVTAEKQMAAIKAAAQDTQDGIAEKAAEQVKTAVDDATATIAKDDPKKSDPAKK